MNISPSQPLILILLVSRSLIGFYRYCFSVTGSMRIHISGSPAEFLAFLFPGIGRSENYKDGSTAFIKRALIELMVFNE